VTKKSKQGTCKVFLTHRAVADLIGIEEYTVARWGKGAATKYIAKFEKAFSLIELNADLLLPNPSLSDDLLFFRVEKHLMACIRMPAGVAVLTIIHANRDLPNILHDLTPTLKEEVAFFRGTLGE
jgi:plasmid stabilization system protein ParE